MRKLMGRFAADQEHPACRPAVPRLYRAARETRKKKMQLYCTNRRRETKFVYNTVTNVDMHRTQLLPVTLTVL